MSRNLPPHPNLEHLKKQAKDLLHDLQQQNPALKLADAQYALAREYGFASWPKLKAYVESLPRPAEDTLVPSGAESLVVSEMANPFVGKWRANLSKSKRHPGNQFQSAMLEFTVESNRVTIVDVVIDDSGHEESNKNTTLVDGDEHPSENDNGYVLIAKWRGPRVLETVAKKDGQVVGWGKYEVSDDGKTLTISGDEQIILLDRA